MTAAAAPAEYKSPTPRYWYLGKPYELDRLFRTVRTALDGKASRPPF